MPLKANINSNNMTNIKNNMGLDNIKPINNKFIEKGFLIGMLNKLSSIIEKIIPIKGEKLH